MSLFDFQSREVVHVKVKLCNNSDDAVYKKFSIDPGITTFEVLQRLLARAFDIRGDFTISYLATDDIGEKVYLSMLSDWDLDAAILSASDPMLRLKITLRNFDNGLDSGVFTFHQVYNQSFEDGLNHDDQQQDCRVACMERDWDIITRGELPLQSQAGLLAATAAAHRQQQQQQQQNSHHNQQTPAAVAQSSSSSALATSPSSGASASAGSAGQFFSQLGSQVGKSMFSQVQKAVGSWKLLPDLSIPSSTTASALSFAAATGFGSSAAASQPPRAPVSDREFQSHLDSAGRVRDFWSLKQAIFLGGLDPSLRKVAWRLLLPVFPKGSTGQERIAFMKRSAVTYNEMKKRWKQAYAAGKLGQGHLSLITAISKDVIRTDRAHPFYSGGSGSLTSGASMADAGEADFSPHILQLFDLLVTYAIFHPSVGYAQGMSDLASPLLVVQEDESYAYIAFCALMCRTKDNFKRESTAMLTKFQHLHDLIVHLDAELAAFLRCHGLADMFFTHRWLLLELKREFEFSDTLRMLEIQWAALPHQFTFPRSQEGVPLQEPGGGAFADSGRSPPQPQSPKDTPYLRLQSLLRQSTAEANANLSTSSSSNSPSATTAVMLKDGVVELPPPEALGCGNPFLLFMCASMLQEHRDRVMRSCHDMCEIVMHFNRLIRSHNLGAILNRARHMFTEYMEAQDDRFSLALTAATHSGAAPAATHPVSASSTAAAAAASVVGGE